MNPNTLTSLALVFVGLAIIAATVRVERDDRGRKRRLAVRLAGITFEHCNYADTDDDEERGLRFPARPTDGAQIAVFESYWIHAGRFAYGFGRYRDWASLLWIEFHFQQTIVTASKPAGRIIGQSNIGVCDGFVMNPNCAGTLILETGYMETPRGWLKLEKPSHISVVIKNRNNVPAELDFYASGVMDTQGRTPADIEQRKSVGAHAIIEPGAITYQSLEHRGEPTDVLELDRFTLRTTPTGPARWKRLSGRPEWKTSFEVQR